MKKLLTTILLCAFLITLFSQDIERKSLTIKRTESRIDLDAYANEGDWLTADIATGFTQFDPNPDSLPSQKTIVKLLYDNEAIYVFAHLHDTSPDSILRELTLRDNTGNADWFSISFDSYRDGQNSLSFAVTSAGVQLDVKYSNQGEDSTWDAVWDSKVRIGEDGWYVELKIPYSALRFSDSNEQLWRMQIMRNIRRHRQTNFWNRMDPNIDGFVNQFGVLEGLENIKSPLRLSINPFVIGYVNTVKDPEANPEKDSGTAWGAGMDLKYGINDAFTLDMALIPDFGQTQSDNQVLNLGPFEQFFEERRPFFTEGTELFSKGDLFYSRRVGGTTFRSAELADNETIVNEPAVTQLYNALKLSGRTFKGTGLGFFNAVEAQEEAIIVNDNGEEREEIVNPLTNYNVFVVDQNLPNNSSLALVNTNVTRQGSFYDANVTGLQGNFRSKNQTWGLDVFGAVSQQFYEDETERGGAYAVELGKISGKWQYNAYANVESDTYDINDLGLLFSNNEFSYGASWQFNQFTPTKKLNRYNINGQIRFERLYRPNAFTATSFNLNTFFFTKKFFGFGFFTGGQPIDAHNYFEPRTGDFETFSKVPAFQYIGGFLSSDYRKTLALDVNVVMGNSYSRGVRYRNYRVSPRWRVNDRILLTLAGNFELGKNQIGYVNRNGYDDDIPEIGSDDILYGLRDRYTWNNSFSARYVHSNTASATVFIRHYQDRVRWHDLGKLNDAGWTDPIAFDGIVDNVPVFDRNVNIFSLDFQFTKRFAPGSDIIFFWKQQIFGSDEEFERNYFQNLIGLNDHFRTNSVSLRIVYFLDYQRIEALRKTPY